VANQLKFTRYVALGIVCAFALLMQGVNAQTQSRPFELMEATIPQLQAALTAGTTTSRDLVKSCAPAGLTSPETTSSHDPQHTKGKFTNRRARPKCRRGDFVFHAMARHEEARDRVRRHRPRLSNIWRAAHLRTSQAP
jgi:hypothetical protein